MKFTIQHALLSTICTFTCILASCAGDASIRAMMPHSAVATHRTGQPVQAAVINGTVRDEILPNILNDDFKQALERSLVKSGLFTGVGGDGIRVEAFITSLNPTRIGEKLRVEMKVRYALRRRSLVILRKTIGSSYEVPIEKVKADLGKMRQATEGAARDNIALLILLIDKQRL